MYRPRADGDPAARAAERTLVVGLTIFAAVLAAGGLLVVGQGLLRHHAAHRASQAVERALGLTPGERVAARLGAAAPAARRRRRCSRARSGWRPGTLQPLGSQARFEPEPGFRAPWEVAVGGALATALAFLALVAVAAALAGRRARGARAARPARAGPPGPALGPEALVGLRLAVRGHGRAVGVSAGAAVAVAGIVAALAFGSGIALLLSDPVRTGQAADLTLEDAEEVDVAKLVVDPRVAALAVTRSVAATARRRRRAAGAGEHAAQGGGARRARQRAAARTGPTEIALSPRIAARRGLNVGDTVTVVNRNGRPLPLTVTGTVAVVDDGGHLGTSNVVTDAALGGLARTSPIVRAEIVAAPGQAGPLAAAAGPQPGDPAPARPRPRCATSPTSRRLPEILAGGARRRRGGGDGAHPHHRRAPPHPGDGRAGRGRRDARAGPRHAGRARRRDRRARAGARRARRAGHRPAAVVAGGDVDRGRRATSTPPVGLLTGTVAGVLVLALLLALVPGLRATRESAAVRLADVLRPG